jgi:hypothetical protein
MVLPETSSSETTSWDQVPEETVRSYFISRLYQVTCSMQHVQLDITSSDTGRVAKSQMKHDFTKVSCLYSDQSFGVICLPLTTTLPIFKIEGRFHMIYLKVVGDIFPATT